MKGEVMKITKFAFVLLFSTAVVFAQQPSQKQGGASADTTRKNSGQTNGGTMECTMMGSGMGMGMMMPRAMLTPDGSIIVISGTKMMKYDKDLNLKKEVTIKVDTTAMKGMMSCPSNKGQVGQQQKQGQQGQGK